MPTPILAPRVVIPPCPSDDEFEPIWNGAIGRTGVSLSGEGMGSSLCGKTFLLRTR